MIIKILLIILIVMSFSLLIYSHIELMRAFREVDKVVNMNKKREDNRFIFTADKIYDKVLMKMHPRALNEEKHKCKYCKHLLVHLDSSTTQTCWLSYNLVNVEDVCENFEFSQKLYDGYNKGDNDE